MNRASFALAVAASIVAGPSIASAASLRDRIATTEAFTGGRLGVAILDTATGATVAYRGNERFPMCSTFKALATGAVLRRIDRGDDRAERRIAYGPRDLLSYAPVTRAHVARGWMTVAELCDAVMTQSDNTAANLLVATLGGPAGVTHFARSIGDPMTRLDQFEPALNFDRPGDPRDSTTPLAMAASLRAIALGDVLSPASRERYGSLLRANQTGGARLRAGVPPGWHVGDKTGTGGGLNTHGDSETRNDIAVLWPPGRLPVIVTAYLAPTTLPAARADAAIASIAALTVAHLAPPRRA